MDAHPPRRRYVLSEVVSTSFKETIGGKATTFSFTGMRRSKGGTADKAGGTFNRGDHTEAASITP